MLKDEIKNISIKKDKKNQVNWVNLPNLRSEP
jgi:hypothetical protein